MADDGFAVQQQQSDPLTLKLVGKKGNVLIQKSAANTFRQASLHLQVRRPLDQIQMTRRPVIIRGANGFQ